MKTTIIFFAAFLLIGCSSTQSFNDIPIHSTEFTKPYYQLRSEYSDVAMYESWFCYPENSPNVSELISAWGEPEKIKKRWIEYGLSLSLLLFLGTLDDYPNEYLPLVFAFSPLPKETYTWNKGNYEITAIGRNDAWVKYQKRMCKWKWKDRN